jgi:hypothetical protein
MDTAGEMMVCGSLRSVIGRCDLMTIFSWRMTMNARSGDEPITVAWYAESNRLGNLIQRR